MQRIFSLELGKEEVDVLMNSMDCYLDYITTHRVEDVTIKQDEVNNLITRLMESIL